MSSIEPQSRLDWNEAVGGNIFHITDNPHVILDSPQKVNLVYFGAIMKRMSTRQQLFPPSAALSLLLVLTGLFLIAGRTHARPLIQDTNLLQNPGFEGDFSAWNGINEIQVAANWTPWWWEDPNHNPVYFRPEYKRALASIYPRRVLSGSSSQQWFTFHASHLAGMYQQVFGVSPGRRYLFQISAQVWSSIEDNPDTSVQPSNPHLQIGIDPTGNWNPGSSAIIWSVDAAMNAVVDQWASLSVEATAQNDVITVFMRTNPDFPNKHNDMYWDNASLTVVGAPEPPAVPPTVTAGPATDVPLATSTVPVVDTAASPTETFTPVPSDTAQPTGTPIPSDTPSPTSFPTSTATSVATVTATQALAAIQTTETPSTDGIGRAAEIDTTESEGSSNVGSGPDPVAIFTLVAIGLLIGLLLLVIVILLRRSSGSGS